MATSKIITHSGIKYNTHTKIKNALKETLGDNFSLINEIKNSSILGVPSINLVFEKDHDRQLIRAILKGAGNPISEKSGYRLSVFGPNLEYLLSKIN